MLWAVVSYRRARQWKKFGRVKGNRRPNVTRFSPRRHQWVSRHRFNCSQLRAIMVDDPPPSRWADKHPKLARLFASVTLLVFAAVTLAWWGVLAWLILRVI